jgi:hypothetical protein
MQHRGRVKDHKKIGGYLNNKIQSPWRSMSLGSKQKFNAIIYTTKEEKYFIT